MMLQKRIALTFSLFSAFAFLANVATPSNPDHLLNLVETGSMTASFALSYFLPVAASGGLQVLSLAVGAFIPMGITDSPFFGAILAVFALVLVYAYGGYRTRPFWKLPASFVSLLILCAISTSRFTPPTQETLIRAIGWTLCICVFLFVLWQVMEAVKLRSNAELIKQNRDLLDINLQLEAGCEDVNNP